MARQTIERNLRAWVAEACGLDPANVIPGDDNGPRPNGMYATVLRLNTAGVGIDSHVYRNDPNDETKLNVDIKGRRDATFSVQFYRNGAYDVADNLLQYQSTPLGQISLQQKNLIWVNASEVRQIDTLVASKYNERAGLDITVKYIDEATQSVNAIGSITFTVNHSGETDISEETTV